MAHCWFFFSNKKSVFDEEPFLEWKSYRYVSYDLDLGDTWLRQYLGLLCRQIWISSSPLFTCEDERAPLKSFHVNQGEKYKQSVAEDSLTMNFWFNSIFVILQITDGFHLLFSCCSSFSINLWCFVIQLFS